MHLPEPAVVVPIQWRRSATRSFVEVPVRGLRFGTIELQVVEHDGTTGHLVVLHQPSGAIEIYAERGLGLDAAWVRSEPPFAHFELALLAETDFRAAQCHVDDDLVDAAVVFDDANGTEVSLEVRSPVRRWPAPLFSPAPRHSNPQTLRFLQQDRFRLLPRVSSDVIVRSGTTIGEPEPFLLPFGRVAPYLGARGSTGVLMAGLAPTVTGGAVPIVGAGDQRLDDDTSVVVESGGLSVIRIEDGARWFDLRFEPALPGVSVYERSDLDSAGSFVVDSPLGSVASGRWALRASADGVRFTLADVDQSWFPGLSNPGRVALWASRRRRRRNERWRYAATIEQVGPTQWSTSGTWSNQQRDAP